MTIDGMVSRGLVKDEDRAALEAMARIAEKERRGETPTEEEYRFIRDGQLWSITCTSSRARQQWPTRHENTLPAF